MSKTNCALTGRARRSYAQLLITHKKLITRVCPNLNHYRHRRIILSAQTCIQVQVHTLAQRQVQFLTSISFIPAHHCCSCCLQRNTQSLSANPVRHRVMGLSSHALCCVLWYVRCKEQICISRFYTLARLNLLWVIFPNLIWF